MGMLLAYYTLLCHIPSKYGWGKCFLVHYRVFLNEFLVSAYDPLQYIQIFTFQWEWTLDKLWGFYWSYKTYFFARASHHALQFRHSYFTSALPLLDCSGGGGGGGGGGRGHCQDGRQPWTSGLHCLWDRRLSASGSSIGQARRKNQNRPRLKNCIFPPGCDQPRPEGGRGPRQLALLGFWGLPACSHAFPRCIGSSEHHHAVNRHRL